VERIDVHYKPSSRLPAWWIAHNRMPKTRAVLRCHCYGMSIWISANIVTTRGAYFSRLFLGRSRRLLQDFSHALSSCNYNTWCTSNSSPLTTTTCKLAVVSRIPSHIPLSWVLLWIANMPSEAYGLYGLCGRLVHCIANHPQSWIAHGQEESFPACSKDKMAKLDNVYIHAYVLPQHKIICL
jgi:hypothetical protein